MPEAEDEDDEAAQQVSRNAADLAASVTGTPVLLPCCTASALQCWC